MPWLYDDANPSQVTEAELREEIRSGALPATAAVRHAPWTGSSPQPIADIEALKADLVDPRARAAARARRWGVPLGGAVLLAMQLALLILDVRVRRHLFREGLWPLAQGRAPLRLPDEPAEWLLLAALVLPGPLLATWAEARYGGRTVLLTVLFMLPSIIIGEHHLFSGHGTELFVPVGFVMFGAALGCIERSRRLLHWSLQSSTERIALALLLLGLSGLPVIAGDVELLLLLGWWILVPAAVAWSVPPAATWSRWGEARVAIALFILGLASFAAISAVA